MTMEEQRAKWNELHKNWVFANQNAREAQNTVIAAYANGTGPSDAQLDEMVILTRRADDAKLAEDDFIEKLFG